jgi:hypothetical protein
MGYAIDMLRRGTALVAVAALGLAACGDTDTDDGAAAGVTQGVTPTTTAGATEPATTAGTTTTTATTTATTTGTSNTTTSTTSAQGSVAPESTTSGPRPTRTPSAERLGSTLVAIDGDGDALAFPDGPTAPPVLLFDGPDPDDPPPAEGPGPNVIDGIALAPDGETAYVGTCCEPIAGTILVTEPPEPASYGPGPPLFGYGPAVSPDGRYLASGQIALGVVSILDRTSDTQLQVPAVDAAAGTYSPYDTMWLDAQRLATLGIWSSGPEPIWAMYPVEVVDGEVRVGERVDLSGSVGSAVDTLLRFAGRVDDDRVALHRRADTSVLAVPFAGGPQAADVETIEVDGVGEPASTLWVEPGEPTIVVSEDRTLYVGGTQVAGEYLWART